VVLEAAASGKQQSAPWTCGAAPAWQQPPEGGSPALPLFKPRSHDLGYSACRIGCSFRTQAVTRRPGSDTCVRMDAGVRTPRARAPAVRESQVACRQPALGNPASPRIRARQGGWRPRQRRSIGEQYRSPAIVRGGFRISSRRAWRDSRSRPRIPKPSASAMLLGTAGAAMVGDGQRVVVR
jgi:hypothetical protein